MTRRRRDRPVFDQLVAELRFEIAVITNPRVNRAITAAHEAAHAVLGDIYGITESVALTGEDEGETYQTVAPRVGGALGMATQRSRESALICLAGPASETIILRRWALAGTGSSSDFLSAWRYLARVAPIAADRERQIRELLFQATQLLAPRWPWLTNVAGHLLEQEKLRAGQVQRILRGGEPDRSQTFFGALQGLP